VTKRMGASLPGSLWRRAWEAELEWILRRANGHPPMTQIHRERALGKMQLLGDLAHTELPLPVEGLSRQGRRFGVLREPRGRPPTRPRARAAVSPAWVRSQIRSRSSSANASNMWKMSFPRLVVVSRFSWRRLQPNPRYARSVTTSMRCRSDRPEALELPDQQDIPSAQMGRHHLQDRALDPCHTNDLLVDLPAASLLEAVELEGETLLRRAHPSIPYLHAVTAHSVLPTACPIPPATATVRQVFETSLYALYPALTTFPTHQCVAAVCRRWMVLGHFVETTHPAMQYCCRLALSPE
jgi:hypothetical protein